MNDREETLRARAEALIELVERELPREYDVRGDKAAWPLIGASLLSRMTTTLRSVFVLQPAGQDTDAGTLVRSLFEHAVHLAWLGADPSPARIEEWRKADLSSRLTADNDCRERGEALFSDADRQALEQQVAGMRGDPLVLVNLTVAADKHWEGELPGMGGQMEISSFRGFYAFLYRQYSGTAHPSYRGINSVVQDVTATRKRVVVGEAYEGNGPYGLATVVYALALYVAQESLGWPDATEVNAIFERSASGSGPGPV